MIYCDEIGSFTTYFFKLTSSGIRAGIGDENQYCDCSAANKLSNHFVTVLVSIHYLSLLCMKYCAVVSGLKHWRPEYMPSSTTTSSTTTLTSTTTTTAATTTTAILDASFENWESELFAGHDVFSTEGRFLHDSNEGLIFFNP